MTPKTCSKESGARLQELGVTVESAFHWKEAKEEYALMGLQVDLVYGFGVHQKYLHQYIFVPAYLAGELGEMLPDYIYLAKKNEEGSLWWCEFEHAPSNEQYRTKHTWGDTMAEAAALMLIWLITEGHVTVEELNQ